MHKHFLVCLVSALWLGFADYAAAHVSYGDLGSFSQAGDSGSITLNHFHRYGWLDGAGNALGDSHKIGSANFFKFTLNEAGTVQISVNATSVLMNPAFSVYAGLLPNQGHDDTIIDPIMPLDSSFYLHTASATDMHPGDPQISHYIPVGYDAAGAPLLDPVGGFPLLVENPIWNTPNPNGIDLGGLTPAQWYAANYTPHDGYRDTLNFTTLGGFKFDSAYGWVPANFDSVNGPYQGYNGQFDAFGNWSMANENGQWSKIDYISSVSSTACAGPNCISTTSGGFINPGHFNGNNSLSETMVLSLAPGSYTIAADGESCDDFSAACRNVFMTASVSATLLSPLISAVPIPGSAWLFATTWLGLCAIGKRKFKSYFRISNYENRC